MGNSPKDDSPRSGDGKPSLRRTGPNIWVLLLIVGVMAVVLATIQNERSRSVIQYSFFLDQIRSGNIASVQLG